MTQGRPHPTCGLHLKHAPGERDPDTPWQAVCMDWGVSNPLRLAANCPGTPHLNLAQDHDVQSCGRQARASLQHSPLPAGVPIPYIPVPPPSQGHQDITAGTNAFLSVQGPWLPSWGGTGCSIKFYTASHVPVCCGRELWGPGWSLARLGGIFQSQVKCHYICKNICGIIQ